MNFFNKCSGDGSCLIPCPCKCSSECKCVHKNHYGYCPNSCCELIHCSNFDLCNSKMPFWILKECNGLCNTCYVQMGNHKLTNITQECAICFEDAVMIELECKHQLCNDCWYNITLAASIDETKQFTPECPLCRSKN